MKFECQKHRHILANWGVIRQLTCEKHNIDQKDLDVLLYFYGTKQGYFKHTDFAQYRRAFPHFKNRFSTYVKKGFFCNYRKAAPKQAAVFMLSHKGVALITTLYKQLFGEMPIRYASEKTYMYGHALPKHGKVVASGLVHKINEANKQRHLSLESD